MPGPIEKPTVNLIGSDGNAFIVMGAVKKALKQAWADQKHIDQYNHRSYVR